jgi:hypothetical protein
MRRSYRGKQTHIQTVSEQNQTRDPTPEAAQDDRRLKQMNEAQVSKRSPTLMTVLLADRVNTSES